MLYNYTRSIVIFIVVQKEYSILHSTYYMVRNNLVKQKCKSKGERNNFNSELESTMNYRVVQSILAFGVIVFY